MGWEQCDVNAAEEEEEEENQDHEHINAEDEEEEFTVPMLVPEDEESLEAEPALADNVEDDADLASNKDEEKTEEPSTPAENDEDKLAENDQEVAFIDDPVQEENDEEIADVDFDEEEEDGDVDEVREFRAIEDAFERLISSLEEVEGVTVEGEHLNL